MSEPVPAALAGERLDRVVAIVTGCSRSSAAGLVRSGAITLDGVVVTTVSVRVAEGAELTIERIPTPVDADPEPDPTVDVPIVHVDDDLIVVDKPAGMIVHPGAGHPDRTMINGLLARYPELAAVGEPERPGVVHRLDAGTTGLLVVARTSAAYENLVGQLAARTVGRRYLAVAAGEIEGDSGLIDAPIGRSGRSPTRMTVTDSGRDARTRYEVLARFTSPAAATWLSCELESGRTHQIRVHLGSIGHPVIGDDKYGGIRNALPFDRPALHAASLSFTHPATGELVSFESAVPADIEALLATLA